MKGLHLVEPAVGLFAFSCFLVAPLIEQFVYRRLWRDITNTTYPEYDNVTRCSNSSDRNGTNNAEEVQKQASLLSLYTELFTAIPSFIVTIFLVTYSDHGGRKIAIIMPVIGLLLYLIGLLAISFFDLNIYFIIGCSIVNSLFGGVGTFLGGCFAYVVDISDGDRQKTLRLAGVDMILGVLGGAAALSTGHFLKAAGFNWPFITSVLGLILVLLYVIFVLEETVKKAPPDASQLSSPPQRVAIGQMFSSICNIFAGGDRRFKAVLIILFASFTVFVFADMGGMSLITLYELNKPLCWTEIMIGYGSAFGTMVLLTSFFGVMAFSYLKVPQAYIVLMGYLSLITGFIMISFAKTTQMMFLARVPLFLCTMPFPVLRSMMSKIVSKSEQGALFACISCMESITSTVSGAVFSSIYAETVAWFPGLVFLLSAGLCTIPAILIVVVILMRVDFSSDDQKPPADLQGLLQEEDDHTED